MIYLDTHVVVWLYLGDMSKFSLPARTAINEHEIKIFPIIALELTYLHEIGRLRTPADTIIDYLVERVQLEFCDMPFRQIIASAIQQTWTRDPFDRMIVGHAAVQECELVTKGDTINANYTRAVW